jgi:WD40 repeat protein
VSWAVTVKVDERRGTGTVISPRLALTCWHVVKDAAAALVLAPGCKPQRFDVADADRELDVALLMLAKGGALLGGDLVVIPREYWRGTRPVGDRALVELCVDEGDFPSSLGVGLRPAAGAAQHVEFVVSGVREGVRTGYSGGPVVELQTGSSVPRLLGIVRARDESTVDAFDHAGTGWFVPVERIAERFWQVAALVETPIERSAAWTSHWQPRSRGVASSTEPGHFFSGREVACAAVREHLEQGLGLAVVTGRRGHGKSAVLAHVVASSCPRYRMLLEGSDADAAARLKAGRLARPVDAAVLGRARASELAVSLARQLGFTPCDPEELVDLVGRERPSCRIVIDGVDESSDPTGVMRDLIVPLSEHATVAIGALREHVEWQAPSTTTWVDLDVAPYRDDAIAPYVQQRLRERGSYSERAAVRVAAAVAQRAQDNFLVAELVSRVLATRAPIDTTEPRWREWLPTDVTDAFREYLGRFGSHQRRVLALLVPLAHAYGEGLTLPITGTSCVWLAAANALKPDIEAPFTDDNLRDACQRAGDYLIVGAEGQGRRLYHEGLAAAVLSLASPDPAAANGAFVAALVDLLPAEQDAAAYAYERLDPYLLRHLPAHLVEHHQQAELLERPGLLLAGDRQALRGALVRGALSIPPEHESARVAVVHALASPHSEGAQRAAALCVALRRQRQRELADRVARAFTSHAASGGQGMDVHTTSGARTERLRYELISGPPLPSVPTSLPDAHSSPVRALAVLEHEVETLIISAGDDRALRSWHIDGSPGPLQHPEPHNGPVRALAVLEHDGEALIISAGDDRALRSWHIDGSPGPLQQPHAHNGAVRALVVLEHRREALIISGGDDRALRSWHIDGSPGPLRQLDAHALTVRALAVLEHDGELLIISGGDDRALRSWHIDGSPGPLQQPHAHNGRVRALAVLEHDGEALIITAGDDRALRSWHIDGSPGPLRQLDAHALTVRALAVLEHDGELFIISAGDDRALRSWHIDGSPGPLQQHDAHRFDWIMALAVVKHDGELLIISAGDDRSLRSWHIDGSSGPLQQPEAHYRVSERIRALLVLEHDGETLIVSAGADRALRSWHIDGRPGPLQRPDAHRERIMALAVLEHHGETLIISAGADHALRSWRIDGRPGPLQHPDAHNDLVRALAVLEHNGETLIISAGNDRSLRSWRIDGSPGPLQQPDAHNGAIRALTLLQHDREALVVSAGDDGALRSWHIDGRPGPLQQPDAHNDWIMALAVVQHDGDTLIISGGDDRALRSWYIDGSPGPLQQPDAHNEMIVTLAVLEHHGETLIISAGADHALRSWHIDGRPGPLQHPDAHNDWIMALAVVQHDGDTLIISTGSDGTILAHRAN